MSICPGHHNGSKMYSVADQLTIGDRRLLVTPGIYHLLTLGSRVLYHLLVVTQQ